MRDSTGEVETMTGLAASTVMIDYPSWSFDRQRIYFSLSRTTGGVYAIEGF